MEEEDTSTCERRSLRKRPSKPPLMTKRRKSDLYQPPQEPENIEDLYRQDSSKISDFYPTALETIYESPKGKIERLKTFMGVVKLRRQCKFSPFYDPPKNKITQRKKKAKSLKRIGMKSYSNNVTIEQVEKALRDISEDTEDENISPNYMDNSFNEDWCDENNIIIPDTSFNSSCINISSNLEAMIVENNEKSEIKMNDASNSHGNNMQYDIGDDFIGNIMDLDNSHNLQLIIPSPTKSTKREKSKKDRRRSGRIPYGILSNIESPIHDKSLNIENSSSNIQNLTSNMQNSSSNIQNTNLITATEIDNISTMAIEERVPSPKSELLHITIKNKLSDKKVKKKSIRRTSGIRRRLYNSILNQFIDDNQTDKLPEDPDNSLNLISPINDKKGDIKVQSNILNNHEIFQETDTTQIFSSSPLLKLDKLYISSPIIQNYQEIKMTDKGSPNLQIQEDSKRNYKNRRRSARLSFGGAGMGSLWTGSTSPESKPCTSTVQSNFLSSNKNEKCTSADSPNLNLDVNYDSSKHIPGSKVYTNKISNSFLIDHCNEMQSCSSVSPVIYAQPNSNDDNLINIDNSPVLSGMFDGSAKILKGKTIIVDDKKSSVDLKYFVPYKF